MFRVIALLVVCLIPMVASHAQKKSAADQLLGYWYTEDNDSIVHILKSEKKYSGKIIWLKEPRFEKGDKNAGKLKSDRLNPVKKKRKTPIIGLSMLKGFSYSTSDKKWASGIIYDPEVGKEYKCEIKFEKDPKARTGKRLYVRGYLGLPILGRTTYWYRVSKADLEKYELLETKEKE